MWAKIQGPLATRRSKNIPTKVQKAFGGFIKGILRGVRCTKSLRVLFLHRRPPSWTTLVLYSRALFIFNEPAFSELFHVISTFLNLNRIRELIPSSLVRIALNCFPKYQRTSFEDPVLNPRCKVFAGTSGLSQKPIEQMSNVPS
jgi:hypothetical protein